MSDSPPLAQRLSLIVVTDEKLASGGKLVEVVRAALRGGAPAIQLRAKTLSAREMVALTRALLRETRPAGALLFVNDRVDVALAGGADGAHLGDEDLPLPAARRIVPPGFLLGRSVDDPKQARQAEREGADYVGVGPMYLTGSKPDAGSPIGAAGVAAVASAVTVPAVAIGGIDLRTVGEVRRTGAAGIAVISAVMQAPDPEAVTRQLLQRLAGGSDERER